MTYREIFKNIYYENKKFIRVYIALCLIFSIFFFGSSRIAFAGQNYNATEIISIVGGNGGVAIVPLLQACFSGIDISTSMMLMSAISVAFQFLPESSVSTVKNLIGLNLSSFSFGIFDFNIFRVFFLVWFIIAKLSRSNKVSYTVGLIFENLENKAGILINFIAAAVSFLANASSGTTVHAASGTLSSQPPVVARYGFNALTCFILLISVLIIYLFIRCFFFFLDIILLPVSILVPFFAFGIEITKIWGIIGLIYLALFHPYVFAGIVLMILIIAIILFKKAYVTIRYFKNIYVKPFFRKLRGYDSDISLIAPKVPKKVKDFAEELNPDIMIPVYLIKRINGYKHVHRHDRWWFISARDKQFICNPLFLKNTCRCIELNKNPDQKIFIKKSLRFFEIFIINGNEENIGRIFRKVHKKIHFVFSKEYYYRFNEVKEMTKFTDYNEYAEQIRQDINLSRKEQREQKRQERLEAKEEKRIARQKNKTLAQ